MGRPSPTDPDRPTTYLFRTTEDKVDEHLASIAEVGDVVEHTIFKGGRDYVLVVRRAREVQPLTVRLDDDTVACLVRVYGAAARKAAGAGAVTGSRHGARS